MEFLPFSLQILLAAFLVVLLSLQICRKNQNNDSAVKLPPGPSKLPLIGNLHHLLGSLPHRALRDLANKYGSLMHLQLGEISAVIISSSEHAREILMVNDAVFASRPYMLAGDIITYGCTNVGAAPYGDYWRHLKKIYATELLSSKRVKSFWSIREDELTMLMKRIASSEGVLFNLTKEVTSSMYTITSKAAFGRTCQDHEKFVDIAKQVMTVAGGLSMADLYPSAKWLQYATGMRFKLMKLRRQADRILEKIVEEHKLKKSTASSDGELDEAEDLVDVLLRFLDTDFEQRFCLTTDNVKAVIMEVFTAGSDTITITVDWAMSEMIRNPRVLRKAQSEVREVIGMKRKFDETGMSEMQYLKLVVKETLRLHPPGALLLPRVCGQSCNIGGYDIPQKTQILVNAWAILRDPKRWIDPESFYPERFIGSSMDYRGTHFDYIPFGAGRRMCPGVTYGITNAESILALLLYHFDWKLPNGMKNENLDMTEASGLAVRRKCDLELIPLVLHPLQNSRMI